MKTAKNVLSLDSKEAMDYFLKTEQYHGFELPEYFVFDELLNFVRETVADTPYEQCLANDVLPDDLPDVNLDILLNKDGHYAVRPIILANPYLYYFLVREICNEQSWKTVNQLFEKFNVPNITSCALPVIRNDKEKFHNATTVFNWWNSMEQRSIELSLEYRYMFMTDITNCYGSVNPQAFDWAFTLKDTQYEAKTESSISKNIQKYLRAFQQGRNIGIPQGSAIFDFVGEIILGYSDLLLYEAIQREKITARYEIIRYRDDYRIFCNDKGELEKISYILQHVLEKLNFRMNSKKTKVSDDIVADSIKPDKLAYIQNTPICNKEGYDFDSFEKHLLYILGFARKYPDSGSVKTLLSEFDERLKNWFDDKDKKAEKEDQSEEVELGFDVEGIGHINVFNSAKIYGAKHYIPGGNVRAMVAVCTQIALENVGCCPKALQIISRMVEKSVKDEDEKWDIIDKVYTKLKNLPNSDYNQLWLQNITYQHDKKTGKSPYPMRLCRVTAGDKDVEPWNNKWLKTSFTKNFPGSSMIDQEVLKNVTPIITFRERRQYDEMNIQ